jgi:TatD DNase family protein
MARLIDSHCHLTFDGLREQVSSVIERASAVGVDELVTVAQDLADAEAALKLSAEHENVRVVAGIHPHESGKAPDGWQDALRSIAARADVFAIGETGLDYHYDFSDRRAQLDVFTRQVEIAKELGKPIVIHSREAQDDVLKVLDGFQDLAGVVFHCFTGTQAEAEQILERGHWLSLTGVVTFKRSDPLRSVARMIPADRLMIETDAPYISPEPVRNIHPNEPAHLVHTAACVATVRGVNLNDLASQVTDNTRRFFGLPTK